MLHFLYADIINRIKFGFQDAASPIVEGIHDLHDHIMFFIYLIVALVLFLIFDAVYSAYPVAAWQRDMFKTDAEWLQARKIHLPHWVIKSALARRVLHDNMLETIWTLFPSIILMLIGAVSFVLLYCMDEPVDAALTIKAIGHQWYWSYEYYAHVDWYTYCGILNLGGQGEHFFALARALKAEGIDLSNFPVKAVAHVTGDSYLITEADLAKGQVRLLETDHILVIPSECHVKLLVTADDVIHSWALPAFGIKIDGVPGRLNQTFLFAKRTGMFYGQCSEICGAGHGFMPIQVMAVPYQDWFNWICSQKGAKVN